MEKLIELLNEYETPRSGIVFKSYDDYDGTFYGVDCDGETEIAWSDSLICSKRFGFIKWLVDNDKINLDRVPNIFTTRARDRDDVIYAIRVEHNYNILNEQYGVDLVDDVIMYVSIQDEPIKFLISVLKNV